MSMLTRRTPNERYIDRGHVGCPRQGRDVELDVCLACRFLEEARTAGRLPYVRCNPPARIVVP
jgi:hypothetical protein